ncbi:hypothetical protein T265_08750 [Opisthorchis viverrini]|uniref:Uncharacterized protein n=1 Tax=Opisthorchis viverrini TaxID=6198 RepID=A0A074Z8A1_OPIVI|nr:hypothetical protein T265_08750 [Opisthorchis viverrini]KER23338.1 hypothetical protein T265_08750 [Opisthorchis viverrini]
MTGEAWESSTSSREEVVAKNRKHSTRVSLLLELISSAYPMAAPGFELRTTDMRGECVTTTPPTHVKCI